MTRRILPHPPRPPKKGAKLFVAGPGQHEAYLGPGAGKWDAYARGYRLASELLAGHVGDSVFHSSLLGFPILFLYRHYLELRIKDLGDIAAEFLGQEYPEPTHDLLKLWRGVRPNLEEVLQESAEHFDAVEETIREFSAVDQHFYAFRYPVDRNREPTLRAYPRSVRLDPDGQPVDAEPAGPPSPWRIDVSHLKEIMEGVGDVLDGCSDAMREALRAKWDEWAEMGGDYAP